ncbi:twin-arginine translocase subunit TatC [Acidipila sp. EB88]|uniref:twin-arginine translocase subunit TatC n=1 Tax=Acidipila sp. EB88 TaxID=2305226 RepID=UPI000F5DDDBF|nr:twin-arginine translocase subunit TatC [Acidipila sp. EB88]RRA48684.1 twin-arginine translocase subunit TatC [Acidipila sp. EB88]
MADAAEAVDRARTAVTERVELPGMSLLEHLNELRKRFVHSIVALVLGFFVAYGFHERIFVFMQQPITVALKRHHLDTQLVYHNPVDGFNLYLKLSFMVGAILAAPYILFQIWLFISPGLYKHERRYVWPFMLATVSLFFGGAFFGYRFVFPGSLDFLLSYSDKFRPLIEINEYTGLFLTVILGLGATFELPILVMFLSLFGIVSPRFLWTNIRYAILIIFVIAAIITPTPDIIMMCLFASPMLVLYLVSIGVSYMVHPGRRRRALDSAAK